jgi:hypothetical protein
MTQSDAMNLSFPKIQSGGIGRLLENCNPSGFGHDLL